MQLFQQAFYLNRCEITEPSVSTAFNAWQALTAHGIGTSVHYRPLHQMTYWKERYPPKPGDFVIADRYFAGAMTLPLFPGMTDAQVDRVAQLVRRGLK